ncbi:hypothetical protein AB0K60_16155 [Thermopolyspora sp. NPDC052614]|uniref:hypothetical protein n=1 Tax=Thermopolyspora sp. NPDC052614 TaxID=3155682 RepID=UPI00341A095C
MRMMTVRLPKGATLATATEKLGLSENDVDTGYGLVLIDPARSLYGLRVTDEAARKVNPTDKADKDEGTYADPRIEPFGPPQ